MSEITFRPLASNERQKLLDALRGNASDGAALYTDPRDTSFVGTGDSLDAEVVSAIRSVPTHY